MSDYIIVGSDHYFTGPLVHDPMAWVIGLAILGGIGFAWRYFDMSWPSL